MSINEGLGTAINIRVMERCDWINLQRKKNTTSASRMKFKWSVIDTKFLSDIIFFSCHAFEGSYSWQSTDSLSLRVTEKKRNITLNNQRRSCNFDKLRKEESSLSYWVVASENEGSRPSCEWKWGTQGDWGQQPFSPNHNPHGKAIENPSGLLKPSPRPWLRARSIQPKFRPGPPQKMDQFFRNFSRWTEPIHWVLDRNSRNFGRMDRTQKYSQVNLQAHLEVRNACADLGYGWTRARPSAPTPTQMLPNAIKTLHNPKRFWQRSCSWSLTTLNFI